MHRFFKKYNPANIIISCLATILLFSSCFPDENDFEPIPIDGLVGEITHSIYDQQTYFNLASNTETGYNQVDAWDLGFECLPNGEHIILNSGAMLSVANLGAITFENNITIPDNTVWKYDASSGNKDSLAIDNWVNTSITPYTYTHNVYIIKKEDTPFKKFKIVSLSNTQYTIIISPLNTFTPDTLIVKKNNELNYSKISLQNSNEIITIEPPFTNWDIQFTTYQSIIPDDNGVATPYVVRGVLSNPSGIEVAYLRISNDEVPQRPEGEKKIEETELEQYFLDISMNTIKDLQYSTNIDAIGYDWKDVTIDFESGSAVYSANTRNIYLIKTQNGVIYKLRFISYYNASGLKGYPTFHYLKMN